MIPPRQKYSNTLSRRNLSGKAYLATVTDLLQRARLEQAYGGLYEAADAQWWWREDDAAIAERQTFWFDEHGRAVAGLVRFDAGDEWSNDFFYLPLARPEIDELVMPEVVALVSKTDKPTTLAVREDDRVLQQALEDAGFIADDAVLVLAELASDPVRTHLQPGFRLTSRDEDEMPHHMIRRNGSEIARKLSECSLYRPELDLCVRDASGSVAAYALFWMDDMTKVGLLEPLRTEREFRRMGLGRHLIAEGVARLRALGAASIRVNYGSDNEAAATLYHQAGFLDRAKKITYRH